MKALRVLTGLVFDDPWLFLGLLAAVALAFLLVSAGLAAEAALVLVLGVLAALALSVGHASAPRTPRTGRPGLPK